MPDLVSLAGPARGNFTVPDATLLPWSKIAAGTWEPYTFELMDDLLGPDRAFLDVGAYVGPLSLYAASLGASVYAIEADVDNFALLLENVRANPELWPRISPHFVCVADEVRIGVMSKPAGTSMSAVSTSAASFGESAGFGARTEWSVPCVNFGDYLEEVERLAASSQPPIIAMDIEGAEAPALTSAFDRFARLPPASLPPLILELHPGLADDRVSYVASVCRVLALWPNVYFLGRENEQRCTARDGCWWPALLLRFESVHELARHLSVTSDDALMVFAAAEPPPRVRVGALPKAKT